MNMVFSTVVRGVQSGARPVCNRVRVGDMRRQIDCLRSEMDEGEPILYMQGNVFPPNSEIPPTRCGALREFTQTYQRPTDVP